jgi:hypothetical protein
MTVIHARARTADLRVIVDRGRVGERLISCRGRSEYVPSCPMPSLPFYEASLRGLQYIEARSPTGRRFGPDADAMWRTFRGHLTAADRIDLLLRDADAEYPGAFGARVAFGLRGVGEDDAFGSSWQRLGPTDADALWRRSIAEPAPADVPNAISACAASLGIPIQSCAAPKLTANTRLLLAGPSAIASVAAAFAKDRDLAWAEQVTCMATPPAHRQLAVLSAALLGAKPTALFAAAESLPARAHFDHRLASDDADQADRAIVEAS